MLFAEDAATLQAYITGVDGAARAAETKWGMDRLPMLVSDDLRAKFNRQVVRWQTAIAEAFNAAFLTVDQIADCASKSAAMQRAWAALDAAATEAGERPVAPWVWEATLKDGQVVAVVQTNAEVAKVIAGGRHLVVYTMGEIANLLDALPELIKTAKEVFPGTTVLTPRRSDRSWVESGDPIPF